MQENLVIFQNGVLPDVRQPVRYQLHEPARYSEGKLEGKACKDAAGTLANWGGVDDGQCSTELLGCQVVPHQTGRNEGCFLPSKRPSSRSRLPSPFETLSSRFNNLKLNGSGKRSISYRAVVRVGNMAGVNDVLQQSNSVIRSLNVSTQTQSPSDSSIGSTIGTGVNEAFSGNPG